MKAIRLFRLLNLRYMRKRRLQLLLWFVGIALGVGAVVGVDLANQSALASFRRSVEVVSGKATLQVVADGGGFLDEGVLEKLRHVAGVEHAAPLIEQVVPIEEADGQIVDLLGLDPELDKPFRTFEARRVAASRPTGELTTGAVALRLGEEFAEKYKISPGQIIHGLTGEVRSEFVVEDTFEPETLKAFGSNLASINLRDAQSLFGMEGLVSRIDLIASGEAEQAVRAILPAGASVVRPEMRSEHVESMMASYHMNMRMLSALALFVGWFLIYNTLTFSVIQRRVQIGVCRCLGMTRLQLVTLFMCEALLVSAAGSAVGLGGGLLLARQTLKFVAAGMSSLLLPVSASHVVITPSLMIKAFSLGIATSLLAALLPAIEAVRVRPVEAVSRAQVNTRVRRASPYLAWAGVACLLLALLPLLWPGRSLHPLYASSTAIKIGFALLSPLLAYVIVRGLSPAVRLFAGIVPDLAMRNVVAMLSRTGPALAALIACLSVTIAISIMITSFRASIGEWLDDLLVGDVWIQSAGWNTLRSDSFVPPRISDLVSQDPDVADVMLFHERRIEIAGTEATLVARDFDPERPGPKYQLVDGSDEGVIAELRQGAAVMISEALSNALNAHRGAMLELPAPDGPRYFRIAGVYREFRPGGGRVLIDREAYIRAWNDTRINFVLLYARAGTDIDALMERVRGLDPAMRALAVVPNAQIRSQAASVFDSTMAVTYVVQVLAMLVATCGVFFALMALLFERTRELGTLRALGMTFPQLVTMLVTEVLTIALIASLVGSLSGAIEAGLTLRMINMRTLGWNVPVQMAFAPFWHNALLAVAAVLCAAIYPAIRMRHIRIASAIHEE